MKHICYLDSPIGMLCIEEENEHITRVYLSMNHSEQESTSPVLQEAKRQLKEYFEKKRTTFELPLDPKGTPFQKQVWNALCTIPYGTTCCYKDIATKINNPRACQSVGQANSKNPIMIIIPCHRVISADGTLGGYNAGLEVKQYLLNIERKEHR